MLETVAGRSASNLPAFDRPDDVAGRRTPRLLGVLRVQQRSTHHSRDSPAFRSQVTQFTR
jgi:hypothetical protein